MLLENTLNKNFKRKNIKVTSAPRTNGSNLQELSGLYMCSPGKKEDENRLTITELIGKNKYRDLINYASDAHSQPFLKVNGEEGISTILIETSHIDGHEGLNDFLT
ncbi:hypothetical protein [Jeotgalibacillus salarius]|uniref:Uncharacterized protein n=1 Tax=Jeotgalibacillus salarius TaxID=546023 RepID=A0A4Y8LDA2_9BACL|nr:hypothetical protein [Jeotgalibacillus salarius]TFE00664.1 hypothetical protein E2626_11875 [Jeotgalibacillus salarius]